MKTKYVLVIIKLVLIMAFSASESFGQLKTENVFIVVIDGLRSEEAFKYEGRFTPLLWDSLKPLGTYYPNFFNTGVTTTNSGNSTIATGVRQLLLINTGVETNLRPKHPTVGEYYRKFFNAPQNEVYYLTGKERIWNFPVSHYPGYGAEYAPEIITMHSALGDLEVLDSTLAVIDRDHPKLCYVLFGKVDSDGHSRDTTRYHEGIQLADSLIFTLWKKIQSDSVYANKTTMLITCDHGRHDEQHGGWYNHGDACMGCRNILFLAIGPDIKKNTVITKIRDQIDITPTVGYLLGFPTPLAEGTPMIEMLENPGPLSENVFERDQSAELSEFFKNASKTKGFSRYPSVVKNNKGLHLVYTDDSNGRNEIYYSFSTDDGLTWSNPDIIFSDPNGQYLYSDITAFGQEGIFVTSTGYTYYPDDTTYVWVSRGKRSTDSGLSWGDEILLDSLDTISHIPSLASQDNLISSSSVVYHSYRGSFSQDGGITFDQSKLISKFGYPESPSTLYMDSTLYSVWSNLTWDYDVYNIWFDKEPLGEDQIITTGQINRYVFDPSLGSDSEKNLHLVFSDALVQDTLRRVLWNITYKKSTDLGESWSASTNISGNNLAYKPVLRVSDNDKIFVLWSRAKSDAYGIWGTVSTDLGNSWITPFALTPSRNFITNPDFAVQGDTIYFVWQNLLGNNWEIFSGKYVFSLSSTDTPKVFNSTIPESYSLEQNYPNPFNPKTSIHYQIPEATNVKIVVYDILGNQINTLINEYKQAGFYEVSFDGNNLPSGVYFYSIEAGHFSDTKKMILAK
ncbi:MAG: hypothetical protein Kow0098_01940 [Ignavibacteriaceae bacterium]